MGTYFVLQMLDEDLCGIAKLLTRKDVCGLLGYKNEETWTVFLHTMNRPKLNS